MRGQRVSECCRQFENGRMDIRDDGRTCQSSTQRTGVNEAQAEEIILGGRRLRNDGNLCSWMVANGRIRFIPRRTL